MTTIGLASVRRAFTASRTRRAAGCGLLLCLVACSTTTTNQVNNDPKERLTASDESDATRRARTRMELATAYFSRNQMTTALDQVKIAIAADPLYAQAFNLRGLIYANLGDIGLAEESFKRALQIAPRDADAMHNYGWFLCQQKRYPEATVFFNQALAVPQYRDASRTLLTQGVCQSFAGQLAEADATLSHAFENDPSNINIAVNLSQVLYERGEFERARFYVRRVNAQRETSTAQTLWLAARIEMKLGNRQGASELGTQLSNRFPDSREAAAYSRGRFDD